MKKISSIAGLSLKPEDPKWKQLAKIGATLIPHKPGVEREIINTLKEVRTTPRGRPRAYEIAAHCKEVLSGVDYIHNTLWLEHRTLNSDSILLSRDGSVKIVNVAVCMHRGDTNINPQKGRQIFRSRFTVTDGAQHISARYRYTELKSNRM